MCWHNYIFVENIASNENILKLKKNTLTYLFMETTQDMALLVITHNTFVKTSKEGQWKSLVDWKLVD